MQDVTNWEPLFEALASGRLFVAVGIRRYQCLVDWPSVVQEWRDELPRLITAVATRHGIFFSRQMWLPLGAGYSMTWDVVKAQALLDEHSVPRRTWLASELKRFAVTGSSGGSPHLSAAGPIIWADYALAEPTGIIIDGNHRVQRANEDAILSGYKLPKRLMLECLATDTHRRFYEWHLSIANWLWAESEPEMPPQVPIPARFAWKPS